MSWKKHFSATNNSGLPWNLTGQINTATNDGPLGAAHSARFASWLPEIYAGPPNRLQRYMQYEQMDQDSEISAALDIIAEYATQKNDVTETPFEIKYTETPGEIESEILTETLTQWVQLNKLNMRAYKIFRNTVKYGDQFFIRDPQTYELYWVDPANVEKVVVNETAGKKIQTYFIKNLAPNFGEMAITDPSPLKNRPYATGSGFTGTMTPTDVANSGGGANYITGSGTDAGIPVKAKHVVHISLTEGMDMAWPFGISILEPIYKVFKQKELLEDSIIIYRVHRAPERRVFFIDIGNMPAHRAKQYIEQVKYDVQQKHVPNKNALGQGIMDAAYNPMSMLEDYFFPQTADGRGSKVETLDGGENLGQIDDLKFWNNKLLRGLKVPSSYLPTGPDDGTATSQDGKVGVAYIQEYMFSTYLERLQRQLEESLDHEFKMYLKYKGIDIDNSDFSIKFNTPMNFNSYRELAIDTERTSLYGSVADDPVLSKRFKLKKYLQLTDDEIKENEKLWREERDVDQYQAKDEEEANLRTMGVRADDDLAVDGEIDQEQLDDLEDIDPELGNDNELNTNMQTPNNPNPPAEDF